MDDELSTWSHLKSGKQKIVKTGIMPVIEEAESVDLEENVSVVLV